MVIGSGEERIKGAVGFMFSFTDTLACVDVHKIKTPCPLV